MARIPQAVPGLIFRYGYLWLEEHRRGRIDPVKDRPACIAICVAETGDASLRLTDGTGVAPGDVIILPITTKQPSSGATAIELTPADKRLCRLDADRRSWLIVSEFNADTWPNADLTTLPGSDQIAYGIAPPGLLRRIGMAFAQARGTGKILGVKR